MRKTFRFAILFSVIIFQSGCKKEFNDLGTQVIVAEDLDVLLFDDQAIKLSVVKEDSLVSLNAPNTFLGSINDEYFGQTNASIYTELRMASSNLYFGEFPVADSLVLSLAVNGYYGDTLSTLYVRVMRMLEQIETTETDSLGESNNLSVYSSDDFQFDGQELGSTEFTIEPGFSNDLRIDLSAVLAQEILEADSLNFIDNEAFQDFFSGLYIVCDEQTENGVLLSLDLLDVSSKMTIYYHTESSDSLSYDFQINSSADRMTRWQHDYSNTEIENLIESSSTNRGYVQGGVGLRTYIDLPDLSSLKDSNYVIHKAELILPYVSLYLDETFDTPSSLGLAALTEGKNIEILIEDQTIQGSSYFDGNRNETNQEYKFNIARYIYKVVEEGYTSRLCLYVPYSISNPERVMINNYFVDDSIGVRLRLFVTEQ